MVPLVQHLRDFTQSRTVRLASQGAPALQGVGRAGGYQGRVSLLRLLFNGRIEGWGETEGAAQSQVLMGGGRGTGRGGVRVTCGKGREWELESGRGPSTGSQLFVALHSPQDRRHATV